ncbi:Tetratricopeptide repeat-containing protein [Tessaracoccus flavus]|nr:Tetratricopeptide repeat-containing protein [Tessaracoccus flavus]
MREAAAETAYAAGEYAVALREFRAIRRMTGGDELLPVIADCERALGRPRDALEVLAELDESTKDVNLRIECLLVEAGIRRDLGQEAEAYRLLKAAISRKIGSPLAQARLRYALANMLELDGDTAGAREWFTSAASMDPGGVLDLSDRIAALDGVVLPDFTPDEEDEDDDAEDDEDWDDVEVEWGDRDDDSDDDDPNDSDDDDDEGDSDEDDDSDDDDSDEDDDAAEDDSDEDDSEEDDDSEDDEDRLRDSDDEETDGSVPAEADQIDPDGEGDDK